MMDEDLSAFMDTFHAVQRIFPLRGEAHELQLVGASYFKALRRYPLSAVQAGAEVWLQRGKRFPRPAEWIESIPPRNTAPGLKQLSELDAANYRRAEQLRYEDAPCGCSSCKAAGVSDKPLRFVPEFDEYDRDAHALLGERVITTGHWAHGAELAGYYRAKAEFYAKVHAMFGAETKAEKRKVQKSFEERLKEIFQERPRVDAGRSDLEPLTPTQETTGADDQPDNKRGSTDAESGQA
jgi:hypothetical protein